MGGVQEASFDNLIFGPPDEIVERVVTEERIVTEIETVVVTDTVFVGSEESRPQVKSSWSEVIDAIEPALYWIGYTAKPTEGQRYLVTFVGTGFAVSEFYIATNYHVASYVDGQFKSFLDGLEPVMIAIRAGTQVFGSETYYMGEVTADRVLLGIWDLRYDGTTSSPDIALFSAQRWSDESFATDLEFVQLAPLGALMDLQVGEEIGIYGFPGVLEINEDPFTLTPTPTLKTGIISALRSYDASDPLTNEQRIALVGQVVQHDLDTSPGNSGSPIFNKRGEVVAIHNAGLVGGDALDFGIRADEIRLLMKSIFRTDVHVNAQRFDNDFQ